MLTLEKDKTTIRIASDGAPLLHYQYVTPASKPHFDVVNLPAGARAAGQNIALNAPHDHVWHFGLFFSQKYIDDINFWESEPLAKKNEPHGVFRHKGEMKTEARDDGAVSFAHEIEWQRSIKEIWVREQREIVVHPPKDGGYRIDWTMTLTAQEADRVLKSLSEHGNYSGLSYRCVRAMDQGRILNSERTTDMRKAHGQPAKWADYSGYLDGCLEYGEPYEAGLAMFDHPDNPGYPVKWFCMNEPFGFLAANRSYGGMWTLPAEAPITVRWGVFVHGGPADADRIEAEHRRFVGR